MSIWDKIRKLFDAPDVFADDENCNVSVSDPTDYKKKYKALQDAIGQCHWVHINVNDFFWWGCADTEQIDADDLEELEPLIIKHGAWAVLGAVVSVKRGGGIKAEDPPQAPVMKMIGQNVWNAAVADVLELAKSGTILFEQYWEREGRQKVVDEQAAKK